MRTPWGPSQTVTQLAPGVTAVTTASHGGILVTGDAADRIPPEVRARAWAGHPWYEEDCDWAIVAWYCPEAFNAAHLEAARRTLRRHHALVIDTPCLCGAPMESARRCVVPDCVVNGRGTPVTRVVDVRPRPFVEGDTRRGEGVRR